MKRFIWGHSSGRQFYLNSGDSSVKNWVWNSEFSPLSSSLFLLPWRQPGLNESPWNGKLNWKLDLTPGPPKYGYKILYIFYTINCPNDHLLILNTNSNTEIFRTSTLFHGRLRSSSNLLLIAWFEMFFDLIFYWNYPVYSFLFNRY